METDKRHISVNETGNRRPFALPDNYFNEFAATMEHLVAQEAMQATGRSPLGVRRVWLYAGVAASLAIAVFTGQWFFANKHADTTAAERYEAYVISQVSESAIIDYYLSEGAE